MAIRRQSIETVDGEIPISWDAGEGPDLPALVVVPSIFGVAPDLEEQAVALASSGAIVAVFDPFWRWRDSRFVAYDDMQTAMACIEELDREAVYADFNKVLGWVRDHEQSNTRVAVLGICFGGPFCLVAAADQLVDGVVTWHGSRMHNWVTRAAEMQCPMKLHFGGDDPFVPMDQVDVVRGAFEGRDDVEIVVHPGASHGFSHGGAAHDPAAAEAGMSAAREMLALLR